MECKPISLPNVYTVFFFLFLWNAQTESTYRFCQKNSSATNKQKKVNIAMIIMVNYKTWRALLDYNKWVNPKMNSWQQKTLQKLTNYINENKFDVEYKEEGLKKDKSKKRSLGWPSTLMLEML